MNFSCSLLTFYNEAIWIQTIIICLLIYGDYDYMYGESIEWRDLFFIIMFTYNRMKFPVCHTLAFSILCIRACLFFYTRRNEIEREFRLGSSYSSKLGSPCCFHETLGLELSPQGCLVLRLSYYVSIFAHAKKSLQFPFRSSDRQGWDSNTKFYIEEL